MRRLWRLLLIVGVIVLCGIWAESLVLRSVANLIGFWPTILLIVLSLFLGIWLTRRESVRTWKTALSEATTSGRLPNGPLADTALILVGGLLLIVPGFISDGIGLLFLLPVTRPFVRSTLGSVFGRTATNRGSHPTVIDGEVVPEDQSANNATVIKGELAG